MGHRWVAQIEKISMDVVFIDHRELRGIGVELPPCLHEVVPDREVPFVCAETPFIALFVCKGHGEGNRLKR